jgi:predicted PurR-regulated permease PerM
MNFPPVPASLERAASWSWRLLVCAAALISVLVVLRYLSVIVLPVMFALTIAPALAPVAGMLHRRLGRPAAALALLFGLGGRRTDRDRCDFGARAEPPPSQ